MRIVDAQVHVWGADTPERPWPAHHHEPHLAQPLTAEGVIARMDEAGVAACVLVPPSWEGDRNDLALAAAARWPDRFAVMGRLDVTLPDAAEQIAHWRSQPGMLGLRFVFSRPHQWAPFVDGSMDWVWGAAERAGLPVMAFVNHDKLHLLGRVAERHPGLRLVVDHLGLRTTESGEAAFRDFGHVLALARYPNVAAKASALPCAAPDAYPYRFLHPYIRSAYDAFGPRRLFWGTDLSRLPCTYRQAITLFTEELAWLGDDDREWIMGRGVCEWLGWQRD